MLRKPPDVLITTPGVALPDAHLAGARDPARRRVGDRRRDPRRRPDQARRPPRADARAPRARWRAAASSASGCRRPSARSRRSAASSSGPARECTIVDTGLRKPLDLEIRVPVEDMREPDAGAERARPRSAGGDGHARRSIWPAIYPELLELVQAHKSTIVFVNNRRARRAARDAPERAGRARTGTHEPADIARAHHGSLAREERLVVEELLKSGELPCLVATSSLELGIDMGAVDLVLQVESPKSVTRGLQRIGRAGHGVGETSKGRIFPKFRADLLECAVVAQRMRDGADRGDGRAAQPARRARAADRRHAWPTGDEWTVPELHELVRRAYPFAELARELLDNVLDMLDGRYPSEEFSELRPRIVWDRVDDMIRARKGARQLAVTNAGTIPDRGLFGVHLPDGRRVGELDEEMVYEARPGQTFMLGASTWRIEEITRDRVLVTPAPGAPGRDPVLARRRRRPAGGARQGDRRVLAHGGGPRAGGARGERLRPRRARGAQPGRLPARAARGHARDPERPDDRGRALPRRDRRLAPVRALALRRARARRLGARADRAHPRRASASRPTRSGRTTGSSSTCPTPTSRPAPTS